MNKVSDLRLAKAVRVPDSDSPEGKLFRTLQAVFDEMSTDAGVPTPMRRRHLHAAAKSAVDVYFVEKLASKAVRYPAAKKGGAAGVEEEG